MLKIKRMSDTSAWNTALGSSRLPMLFPNASASNAQHALPTAVRMASVLSSGRPARTTFSVPSSAAASEDPRDQIKIPLIG